MKNKYINKKGAIAFFSIFIMLFSLTPNLKAQSFTEGFDNTANLVDWFVQNEPNLDADSRRLWHRASLRCRLRPRAVANN